VRPLLDSRSAAPDVAHRTLRALLGDERIRIFRNHNQRDRIEGALRLGIELNGHPTSDARGVPVCLVAGEGFEPSTSGL
jgi:hypothetical protein